MSKESIFGEVNWVKNVEYIKIFLPSAQYNIYIMFMFSWTQVLRLYI